MRQDTPASPSLDRGVALLEVLARSSIKGMKASALQKALGVPRASLYRMLKVLIERRMVEQDPRSGMYRLGNGTMELGFLARRSSPLVTAAMPLLREVAHATHQMSEIATTVGRWELMMVDVWLVEATPLPIVARTGLIFSLNHDVSHGQVYLACDGERRLEEYLARWARGEKPWQSHTPVNRAKLEEACARCRKRGYAWVRQHDRTDPRTRLSVPVFDPRNPGRLAASIGVVCDARAFNSYRAAEWAPVLKEKARQLEKALAGGVPVKP